MRQKQNEPMPISDLLRDTITRAIESGEVTYLGLERDTGCSRLTIMRFATGRQFLRLDIADKLARYFGLELVAIKGK